LTRRHPCSPVLPSTTLFRSRIHPEPVPTVTADMRLRGIHHVSGITDDLERAHDFYEGALGLRIVKRTVNQDDGRTRHWFWASLRDRKSTRLNSSHVKISYAV